ncbi:YggT family protein [Clostridium algidicarnis]|uniref:YggT family protein n=1 Tax=Clostridium algidicarnis TaxID=37659 RepID=UPI001CF2D728|nr:YggT family protein [Clostridium algidicarnis]
MVEYAILIDVVLSFIFREQQNKLINIIKFLTEPILKPAKLLQDKFMPNLSLDFSPVIVLILLYLLESIIMPLVS